MMKNAQAIQIFISTKILEYTQKPIKTRDAKKVFESILCRWNELYKKIQKGTLHSKGCTRNHYIVNIYCSMAFNFLLVCYVFSKGRTTLSLLILWKYFNTPWLEDRVQ